MDDPALDGFLLDTSSLDAGAVRQSSSITMMRIIRKIRERVHKQEPIRLTELVLITDRL